MSLQPFCCHHWCCSGQCPSWRSDSATKEKPSSITFSSMSISVLRSCKQDRWVLVKISRHLFSIGILHVHTVSRFIERLIGEHTKHEAFLFFAVANGGMAPVVNLEWICMWLWIKATVPEERKYRFKMDVMGIWGAFPMRSACLGCLFWN